MTAAADETFTCPECYKPIRRGDAERHGAKHWGAARGFDEAKLSTEGKNKLQYVREQQSAKEG